MPPTIGSDNRRSWFGMAQPGPRVPSVRGGGLGSTRRTWLGMAQPGQRVPSAWAGGMGTENGINWLPIGLGLALGGLVFLAVSGRSGGMLSGLALGSAMDSGDYGMMSNPRRQKITVKTHMRKVPGKRKYKKIKGYSYYR